MLDTVTRALLSPVLIAQALRVRRRAQRLPEAAGARYGTYGNGALLRLHIIGDSSAAGVGVIDQADALSGQLVALLGAEYSVTWELDACTGATTKSTLTRLAEAEPRAADIVVVALGVNDVTRLVPCQRWLKQQHLLVSRINTLHAPHRIYLSGMPPLHHFPLLPNPLRWTLARHARLLERHLIASLSGQQSVVYLPFNIAPAPELMATDGFHPSARLYRLWAKEMASRINADWPPES